jgi:hypothetical protein
LDLEIALGGVSAKVKPLNRLFRTGRKCVETSDDVTKSDFASTPDHVNEVFESANITGVCIVHPAVDVNEKKGTPRLANHVDGSRSL